MHDKDVLTTWERLKYGFGGFIVGAAIVAFAVAGLFLRQLPAHPAPTEPAPIISSSGDPTEISVVNTSTPSAAASLPNLFPEPTANPLIETAETAFNHGDYQQVVKLLEPELANLTQPEEQKQAYWYIGQAEYNLGHFQLASGYFEKLYALDPTNTHLLALAAAYDDGGNTDKALEMYLQVLATDDPSVPPDLRQMIQDRVNTLQVLVSGVTLTPLPIP